MPETTLDPLDVCTGCGDVAFVCIVGSGDPRDVYHGPYALCEDAYKDWTRIGDDILYQHD
jgi:hypothetical protein